MSLVSFPLIPCNKHILPKKHRVSSYNTNTTVCCRDLPKIRLQFHNLENVQDDSNTFPFVACHQNNDIYSTTQHIILYHIIVYLFIYLIVLYHKISHHDIYYHIISYYVTTYIDQLISFHLIKSLLRMPWMAWERVREIF